MMLDVPLRAFVCRTGKLSNHCIPSGGMSGPVDLLLGGVYHSIDGNHQDMVVYSVLRTISSAEIRDQRSFQLWCPIQNGSFLQRTSGSHAFHEAWKAVSLDILGNLHCWRIPAFREPTDSSLSRD